MPWGVGPMTSAAVIVPVTTAGLLVGQAWVPAGPLPRLLQKKTLTPPVVAFAPRWMWDWVTVPSRLAYLRVYWMVPASGSTRSRIDPDPAVDRVKGVSW